MEIGRNFIIGQGVSYETTSVVYIYLYIYIYILNIYKLNILNIYIYIQKLLMCAQCYVYLVCTEHSVVHVLYSVHRGLAAIANSCVVHAQCVQCYTYIVCIVSMYIQCVLYSLFFSLLNFFVLLLMFLIIYYILLFIHPLPHFFSLQFCENRCECKFLCGCEYSMFHQSKDFEFKFVDSRIVDKYLLFCSECFDRHMQQRKKIFWVFFL